MSKSIEKHAQDVAELQQALAGKHSQIILSSTTASNTLRNKNSKKFSTIDLSKLNKVIEINTQENWVLVEPKVTFSDLCQFTLTYGRIPLVVPEFKTITVGGAIMGAAIESSSHRYGQVNDTCLEVECLLGNGERITASPTVHHDLFYGLSGSYGTLALVTMVKLKLQESKPYVHINFSPHTQTQSAIHHLTASHPEEFVEGVVFSEDHTVVATGQLIHEVKGELFTQSSSYSPWYVQYLKMASKPTTMPLYDYLFRYDRGAFWMGRFVRSPYVMTQLLLKMGIPKVAKGSYSPSFLFRFLFGWAMSSKKLYEFWHRVPTSIAQELFFIHDFYAPAPKASEILSHLMQATHIFPIWLCPVKGTPYPQILSPHYGGSPMVNMGFYGIPQSSFSIPNLTRMLEKDIVDRGGRKMLYSLTYYDEADFWKIYPKDAYDTLRNKYGGEGAFPNLHEKICRNYS